MNNLQEIYLMQNQTFGNNNSSTYDCYDDSYGDAYDDYHNDYDYDADAD